MSEAQAQPLHFFGHWARVADVTQLDAWWWCTQVREDAHAYVVYLVSSHDDEPRAPVVEGSILCLQTTAVEVSRGLHAVLGCWLHPEPFWPPAADYLRGLQ